MLSSGVLTTYQIDWLPYLLCVKNRPKGDNNADQLGEEASVGRRRTTAETQQSRGKTSDHVSVRKAESARLPVKFINS